MLWPSKHETERERSQRLRCAQLGGEELWAECYGKPKVPDVPDPRLPFQVLVAIEGEPLLRGPCAGALKFNPWVYENCVIPYWRGE